MASAAAQVRIRLDERGLSVWHNHKRWVADYHLRDWAPQATWRVAIGARAGRRAERHWFDKLSFESLLLVADAVTTVELSANAQQYSSDATPFVRRSGSLLHPTASIQRPHRSLRLESATHTSRAPPHAHTLGTQSYYAMPIVSSATPASGPIGGSTLVTVSGSKMDLGSRMRCRFGSELRQPSAAGCAPSTATFSNLDSDCRYGDQVVNATLSPTLTLQPNPNANANPNTD